MVWAEAPEERVSAYQIVWIEVADDIPCGEDPKQSPGNAGPIDCGDIVTDSLCAPDNDLDYWIWVVQDTLTGEIRLDTADLNMELLLKDNYLDTIAVSIDGVIDLGTLPGGPLEPNPYFLCVQTITQDETNIYTLNMDCRNPCTMDEDPPGTFLNGCPQEELPSETATITFTVSGEDQYGCTLPENLTYEWWAYCDGGLPYDFTPAPGPEIEVDVWPGEWEFYVRAVDQAGNKDLTPPETIEFLQDILNEVIIEIESGMATE